MKIKNLKFYLPPFCILSFIDQIKLNKEIKKEYFSVKSPIIKPTPKLPKIALEKIKLENVDETINEHLNNFTNIMYNKFYDEDLAIMYHNIKTLKFITDEDAMKLKDGYHSVVAGIYNIKENKVTIFAKNNFRVFYHELLHMASSLYEFDDNKETVIVNTDHGKVEKIIDHSKQTIYSGFAQHNVIYSSGVHTELGVGLNEGYTELLSARYFHKFVEVNKKDVAYQYEKTLASIVENIVGKDLMEKLYFSANLKGLVNELSKYIDSSEVIQFIKELDFYTKYKDAFYDINNISMNLENKAYYGTIFNKLGLFILKVFVNKLVFDNPDLSMEDLSNLLYSRTIFFTDYRLLNRKTNEYYFLVTEEQRNGYIEEVLKIKEHILVK